MIINVHENNGYSVTVGKGVLSKAGNIARDTGAAGRIFIVTDSNVAHLWLDAVSRSFADAGFDVSYSILPAGEAAKNTESLSMLWEKMASAGMKRTDTAAALGGGVIGDLAGFAAASYMRGIRFIQIPTSLLAMTDSSVGGKCGIDIPGAKNAVGVIRRPAAVICDTDVLDTLPAAEYSNGMAEVIKYAFACVPDLLPALESGAPDREYMIARCIEAKKFCVETDEFDTGARRVLNFGHTIGHAIELLSGFRIPHGAAVAAGCAAVCRACAAVGLCPPALPERLSALLRTYGLRDTTDIPAAEIAKAMMTDKKRTGSGVNFVLIKAPGETVIREIPAAELTSFLHLGGIG